MMARQRGREREREWVLTTGAPLCTTDKLHKLVVEYRTIEQRLVVDIGKTLPI